MELQYNVKLTISEATGTIQTRYYVSGKGQLNEQDGFLDSLTLSSAPPFFLERQGKSAPPWGLFEIVMSKTSISWLTDICLAAYHTCFVNNKKSS